MNAEKEKLMHATYQQFMEAGLNLNDGDGIIRIISEEIMGFGTTVDEKIFGQQQVVELLSRQKEQSEGVDMTWKINPLHRYLAPSENMAVFADDIFCIMKIGSETHEFNLRLSLILDYLQDEWLVVHWHGSKPEYVQSEEDTWGIENWRQKTTELEKQVEERTAELIAKNNELELTLSQLKNAQNQLIQSEKMASLGELTAGIAHEIQNPLNFVNNFSEVNKELAEELLDAISKGNMEEIRNIAKDLVANEDKVIHHGKRADSIVKSMLQHSRTSSGEKELTDINALCDEYVRLAYHGMKAKNKNFNADFKMKLDANLPHIKVIPQDIGRVLLNLTNNAFQAVTDVEKPEVVVTTIELEKVIEISVSDNGSGIPESIKDKIFQPFFTTKPTGQGTGLGLSLAYDIVKAHGGKLKVETKEGEGSELIIQLPV